MAGASMNDIKARMKSVTGTMQITKAMELVATSKLRHAKLRAESALPYMRVLLGAIRSISDSAEVGESKWISTNDNGKTLYIVIAGDRGLAGGYNSNVFKTVAKLPDSDGAIYVTIGKKAKDYYQRRQASLYGGSLDYCADVGVGDCFALAELITEGYTRGDFSRVMLVYTEFTSMMVQTPIVTQLLPLDFEAGDDGNILSPIFEGDPEGIIDKIVPMYIGGILHSATASSIASECAARRQAMNSANKNAEEMIADLTLKFNRARQAVITQEITEIVSGAEAL